MRFTEGEMNRLSNYHAHLTPPTLPKKGILVTAPTPYGAGNGPQSLPWGGVSSCTGTPTSSLGTYILLLTAVTNESGEGLTNESGEGSGCRQMLGIGLGPW